MVLNGDTKYLGYFPDEESAAKAIEEAKMKHDEGDGGGGGGDVGEESDKVRQQVAFSVCCST